MREDVSDAAASAALVRRGRRVRSYVGVGDQHARAKGARLEARGRAARRAAAAPAQPAGELRRDRRHSDLAPWHRRASPQASAACAMAYHVLRHGAVPCSTAGAAETRLTEHASRPTPRFVDRAQSNGARSAATRSARWRPDGRIAIESDAASAACADAHRHVPAGGARRPHRGRLRGAINLIWDAEHRERSGGLLVLRGDRRRMACSHRDAGADSGNDLQDTVQPASGTSTPSRPSTRPAMPSPRRAPSRRNGSLKRRMAFS